MNILPRPTYLEQRKVYFENVKNQMKINIYHMKYCDIKRSAVDRNGGYYKALLLEHEILN